MWGESFQQKGAQVTRSGFEERLVPSPCHLPNALQTTPSSFPTKYVSIKGTRAKQTFATNLFLVAIDTNLTVTS